jgi:UDPglucose--hexose-1-phosphate uridylyltransferase
MRSTHAPPHLCHDPLTARSVIVAEERADRPNELSGATIACPFCAGHESLTPPDVLRAPAVAAPSAVLSAGAAWTARIVPNQFPVACDGPTGGANAAGRRPARGVHDVVIESPAHVRSILEVDPAGWRDAWHLCRRRLADLADRGDLAWGMVFKNSGAAAGASLEHVHSQLVALDFVPDGFAAELAAVERAVDPFGDLLRAAADEDRIVEESGDLVALVPPAPRQPFETWILPRSAEPHFHATAAARVESLATLTRSLVGRLDRLVPGAAYNWWLHQYPYGGVPRAGVDARRAAAWHWHLEIMPRINGLAGFELGTGCHVTTMAAVAAARRLRSA